jgi:hypothetical protein
MKYEKFHLIDTERYNTLMDMIQDPLSIGIAKELIMNSDTQDLITAFYVWDLVHRIYDPDFVSYTRHFRSSDDYKKLQREIDRITGQKTSLYSEKNYS